MAILFDIVVSCLIFLGVLTTEPDDASPKRPPAAGSEISAKPTAKEALQGFKDLIGPWRATGAPEGTQREKQKGFWQESHQWEWRFKGDDVYLLLAIEKGKYFTQAELRYLPEKDQFQLTARTPNQETLTFVGAAKEHTLNLERADDKTKETQRLVLSLIHDNRFLYRYEVKPADKTLFKRIYEVGAVKQDVPFADGGSTGPECVVSGGLGTIKVSYKGQTYYVCCSGCRDAFKDNPEKYIKEYEEKKKAKTK
jgi:hypothetical protein